MTRAQAQTRTRVIALHPLRVSPLVRRELLPDSLPESLPESPLVSPLARWVSPLVRSRQIHAPRSRRSVTGASIHHPP